MSLFLINRRHQGFALEQVQLSGRKKLVVFPINWRHQGLATNLNLLLMEFAMRFPINKASPRIGDSPSPVKVKQVSMRFHSIGVTKDWRRESVSIRLVIALECFQSIGVTKDWRLEQLFPFVYTRGQVSNQ